MEQRRRRPRKNQPDPRLILIGLIAVLVVLLITVLCIAFAGNDPKPTAPNNTTNQNASDPDSSTDSTTIPTNPGELTILYPETQNAVSTESTFRFEGSSDPKQALTINGNAVSRDIEGKFNHEVTLVSGLNTFDISYNGETITYTVDYRYVVEHFSPSSDTSYGSGATIYFEVSARTDSQVTVSFNGTTITLAKGANQTGFGASDGFTIYVGQYTLTNTNTSDLNLGQITYTATYNGVTETYTSGNITCQKSSQILSSDPSVTPSTGGYLDVGSGYIGEVINYSAETMYSWDNDGYSHPVNNYLPQGTLDYVSTNVLTSNDGKNNYRLMRCGWRVFTAKNNPPAGKTTVLNCYIGTLPDHNEIGFVSMADQGQYSVMTLDVLWKAPFRFSLEAQDYANPNGGGGRSYEVSDFTSTYIDITFCYATVFTGDITIPADNPLFSRAELTMGESDCTLRLYFKKAGGFYGWDANYNSQGQLCFKFLNPPKVTKADNAYGVNLTGLRIMLDVGHGGVDGGTVGYTSAGVRYTEAERNLNLAMALKAELESMGATVLLNRSGNSTLTVDERILLMRGSNVDLLIAIHHNASSVAASGFESFYYGPISHVVTHQVNNATKAAGIYSRCNVGWHVYYMGRQTYCPVVLTENGYMSNPAEMDSIANQEVTVKKAQAIAQGVANYYLLFAE